MSVFEIHGGNDRRSMIKRYERKSKADAVRELVDLAHCNWRQVELLEKERDAALAELAALKPFCEYCGGNDEFPQDHCMDCTRPAGDVAALKGGQEAVAMIRYARGVPGFENEMPHVVSCNDLPDGLYPVYLAPPAQASAWVPKMEGLCGVSHQLGMVCVHFKNTEQAHSAVRELRAMLAASPTPGASDGKECEK